MAAYLQFDGVDDYIDFSANPITLPTSGDYSIKIKIAPKAVKFPPLVGDSYNYRDGIYLWELDTPTPLVNLRSTFTYDEYVNLRCNAPLIIDGSRVYDFEIRRTGDTIELYLDSVFQDSVTTTAVFGGDDLVWCGKTTNFRGLGDLHSVIIEEAGVETFSLSPSETHRIGATQLIDTVGGNHGTPVGFSDFQASLIEYYDWLNDPVAGGVVDYGLKLTTPSESVSLPLVGAYDVTAHYADDTTENFTGSGTLVIDGTATKHIKYIDGSDSEGSVYFDGNNSPEMSISPELIQGKHGTLVGFPEPSGYVRDSNGEITGYRFNGVNTYAEATIPQVSGDVTLAFDFVYETPQNFSEDNVEVLCLSSGSLGINRMGLTVNQANGYFKIVSNNLTGGYSNVTAVSGQRYTGTIIVSGADVTLNINGQSDIHTASDAAIGSLVFDHVYFGAKYNSSTWFKGRFISAAINSTHFYDFTTGDEDQIIDTVGNNHVTIKNAPTSGYMPVVERQVFTIGADNKDYTALWTFEDAGRTISDAHFHLLLFDAQNAPSQFGTNDTFLEGFTIEGVTDQAEVNGTIDVRGGGAVNLVNFKHTNALISSYNHPCYMTINNLAIDQLGKSSNYIIAFSSGTIQIRNSSFENMPITLSGATENNNVGGIRVYNCIATKSQRADRPPFRNGVICHNCISFDNAGDDFGTISSESSNNVSEDTTGDIQLADIATAFADPATSDYRIKQSYADANLVDQGYMGSDIAGWAYYDDATTGDVSVSVLMDAISSMSTQEDYNKLISSIIEASPDLTVVHATSQVIEAVVSLLIDSVGSVDSVIAKQVLQNTSVDANTDITAQISVIKSIASVISSEGSLSSLVSSSKSTNSVLIDSASDLSSAINKGVISSTILDSISTIDLLTTVQKAVDIVVDSLSDISVAILSDTIKEVAVSLAITSKGDINPTLLAAKITNIIAINAEADANSLVSKSTDTITNILAEADLFTSVLRSGSTPINVVIDSIGALSTTSIKGARVVSSVDSGSDQSISVHIGKEVESIDFNATSSAFISIDINKMSATVIDSNPEVNITDVKVNKELNSIIIESSSGIDIVMLSNFEDSNVTLLEVPVRARPRVLEFVVRTR